MGDIHGAYKALLQCLERSNFDYNNDVLIQLGDVADGWDEVYKCVEKLLTIKNLISIKGNHDDWFLDYLLGQSNNHPGYSQGGKATLISYAKALDKKYVDNYNVWNSELNYKDIPESHVNFFKNQLLYYIDKYNRCFVHGGFNRHHYIDKIVNENPYQLYWDRDLWRTALSHKDTNSVFKIKEKFSEIYIGHTTTNMWNTDEPMNASIIWNLDTGAGFKGKLTIMNIDTKEYFQSDSVKELYPNQKGRN